MSAVDGKYGLRVRTKLRKAFFAEPHPTQLINQLLEKYYNGRSER